MSDKLCHQAFPESRSDKSAFNKNTILLVDDEEAIRLMGAMILRREGFRALVARDGHIAIEMFQKCWKEVLLVLLDITMPNLDGRATLEKLREIAPNIPVIICSGYLEEETYACFSEVTNVEFLEKPYEIEELMGKIKDVIGFDNFRDP